MLGRSFLTALVTCTALVVAAPLAATAADPAHGVPAAYVDAGPGPGSWSAGAWLFGWHHHGGATARPPAPSPDPTPAPTTAPAPAEAEAAGNTVTVTIPEVFTVTVLHQDRSAGRCEVLVAVTDNRASHPGFTVSVEGGGRGTLAAEQVPGNGMRADDLQVGRTSAAYPAGLSAGSVRVRGTFASCPSWSLR